MGSFCDFGWVRACHIKAANHVKNTNTDLFKENSACIWISKKPSCENLGKTLLILEARLFSKLHFFSDIIISSL